ncbi:unnamed protein product [Macrosiphum euphorbiae]|uniref:Uncharacterized protein n=1 Tax=Macrosiphum euphorbiae TaxID=13131 RepID=A0AAV0W7B8_9HEMI|nr:unnamed protein product [Macrosiphum euphorbiae]
MVGVSGGGLAGELTDSVCVNGSYRFVVMNSFLFFLFGSGSGELGLEEADRFLLPTLVACPVCMCRVDGCIIFENCVICICGGFIMAS